MNPEEQAGELVERYSSMSFNCNNFEYDKQCALIAVRFYIEQEIERCLAYKGKDNFVDYWEAVEIEIKKL